MLVSKSENKLDSFAILLHLAGGSVAVATMAVIFVLVNGPIDKSYAAATRTMVDIQQLLDREEQLRGEHDQLTNALMIADDRVDRMLDRIPLVPREADFLGQITTLAQEVGLEIVDYRPGETSQRDEYQEMTVRLSSEGSYEGVCKFLKRLSHLPRLSKVNDLEISPRRNGEEFAMNMTLAIYFAPKQQLAVERGPDNG